MTDSTTELREDPARTCVGCRRVDARDELVRFVVGPSDTGSGSGSDTESGSGSDAESGTGSESVRLVPDITHKLPGRGVSVHPTRACLNLAARGGVARSLKRNVSVNAGALAQAASEQYTRRAMGLLSSASRARKLAVGTDAVREAMHTLTTELLVVAHDAMGRREDLEAQAKALGRRCVVFETKQTLGALLGRDEVGVVAVLDEGIATAVLLAVTRAAALLEAE